MISQASTRVRAIILLEFAKELIRAAKPEAVASLKVRVAKEEEKKRLLPLLRPTPQLPQKKKLLPPPKSSLRPITHNLTPKRVQNQLLRPKQLRIEDPTLPETMRDLRPMPTQQNIEGGKLNPFLRNPQIRIIECNGPDEPIVIYAPNPTETQITLTNEDIDELLNFFAKKTNIPVEEGVFKVAYGEFTLTAIVSPEIGTRFVLKRIPRPWHHPESQQ